MVELEPGTCMPAPSAQWDRRVEKKLGNPEEGDKKAARQALTREEASGAVTASEGQEERPRKERRCDQRIVGVLEGSSAIFRVERPRRGKVLKG